MFTQHRIKHNRILNLVWCSALSVVLYCMLGTANAYSLMDIYMRAKQHDADIHIAESRYNAEAQARPIARANVLPQANIRANTTTVNQETTGNTFGIAGREVDFNDHGYTLSITQALYHHDYYVQLRQAKDSVARASVDLDASYQQLMIRTADAYFNVLAEQDNVTFRKSEIEAIERQLEQAQKRFEVGLIAITDVKEAQASYDLAVASEIEANNALEISKDLKGLANFVLCLIACNSSHQTLMMWKNGLIRR